MTFDELTFINLRSSMVTDKALPNETSFGPKPWPNFKIIESSEITMIPLFKIICLKRIINEVFQHRKLK